MPLFCSCQFRRLDSVQFLCSQAHILADWHLESRLTSLHGVELIIIYNHVAQIMQKAEFIVKKVYLQRQRKLIDCRLRIHCGGNAFNESLPSNERLFLFYYSGFRASCIRLLWRSLTKQRNDAGKRNKMFSFTGVSLLWCDVVYYNSGAILWCSQYLQYREPNGSMIDELCAWNDL
jgi:hypothetical protein